MISGGTGGGGSEGQVPWFTLNLPSSVYCWGFSLCKTEFMQVAVLHKIKAEGELIDDY